ncbi:hypothetical protein [Phyllobacterium chamaecytisi]|uniref:hypothetical protein n=1 Tax=Phyllobacterium chamaecytisi TaxID=2876082 RepID=UPI001CCAAB86|nr:hypothetical protein [Phyllobacterium sp. KW56]MBZ9605468.1 hypothetical protein [Phyllobacterium sp. KW56]
MAAKTGILSALIKQANGATDLTREEKQVLLRNAAELIRIYRELVAFSGSPEQDTGSDIAWELEQFAEHIDFKYVDETSEIMLEAADKIRILRLMLGIKQEIIDGTS